MLGMKGVDEESGFAALKGDFGLMIRQWRLEGDPWACKGGLDECLRRA